MRSIHDAAPSYEDGFDLLTSAMVEMRILSHLAPECCASLRKPNLSDYDGDVEE